MVPAEGERRTRFKVLNWGENPNSNGKRVTVGDRLAAEFDKPTYAWRLVPLDYEHNTQPGTAAYAATREPRDIAGYGAVEVIPGDGVYLAMIMWAAQPDGWAAAHTFADVSAVPVLDPATGEAVAVTSVALTRAGAVPGIHFLDVPLSAVPETQPKGRTMNWKTIMATALGLDAGATDADVKAALLTRLGLPEGATDEEFAAALVKAATAPAPQNADPDKDKDKPPVPSPLAATVAQAVNAATAPLAAQVKSLAEAAHRRDVDALLDGARADGKAVPLSAQTAHGLPLSTIKDIIAQTPVTVPLAARPITRDLPLDGGNNTVTAERSAIAAACGVSPDNVWGSKK